MIVPIDAAGYTNYQSIRRTSHCRRRLCFLYRSAGKRTLDAPKPSGSANAVQYEQIAAHIGKRGTLVQPTTRPKLPEISKPADKSLFASDQQDQWQTTPIKGISNGWAGKVADKIAPAFNSGRCFRRFFSSWNPIFSTGDITPSVHR